VQNTGAVGSRSHPGRRALILVNAVYVAAEFAAVSSRRSRIRQLAEEGNRLACWLMPILERPVLLERYIGPAR
jgi:CBS domain containing-hemolysin-like protein